MNKRKQSRIDKKISTFSMVCIAILAIFNLQNVLDNYVGLGLSATVAFLIALVVFMCPFIFMIAEFASLKKGTKSGLTSWIRVSVGRKMAFLTSFMFWFANLTYFFSAIPTRLNFLSFAVTGADHSADPVYMNVLPAVAVVFFLIITLISTLNTKKIAKITSFSGSLMIGVTAFFFVMCVIGWIAGAVDPTIMTKNEAPGLVPNESLNLFGETGGLNFAWMSTFIWVLMAADGGQTLGVYVKDVKGGKRAFTRAMMISVLTIGAFYIIGTLLTSVFPPVGGLANGWANSFANVFAFVLQNAGLEAGVISQIAYIIMGIIFFATSVGGLLIWTSAPVKTMFSEIAPGIFGARLSQENRNGVCSFGAWIQFICVVPFLILLLLPLGSSISENFGIIKGAAGWIGMLPWLVIFLSYINLRRKHDDEERSFKMGPRWFGMTVGIILTVITIGILVITFLDTAPLDQPYSTWASNWWLGPTMKVVMITIILIPAYLWYYFKFEYQQRDTKLLTANNLPTWHALVRYTFTKKIVLWLRPAIYEEYVKQRNKLSRTYDDKFAQQDKVLRDLAQKILVLEDGNEKFYVELAKLNLHIDQHKNNELIVKKSHAKERGLLAKIETNKKTIAELKVKVKAAQKVLVQIAKEEKQAVRKIKRNLKTEIKSYMGTEKKNTQMFYKNTLNPIIQKTKADKSSYKEVMLADIKAETEKDIGFDEGVPKRFGKLQNSYGSQYYNRYSKVGITDSVYYDKKHVILVRDWANSYVGEKLLLKDVRAFVEPDDVSKDVMVNGQYVKLKLVNIVHVENNQFRTIKFYLEDAKKFINFVNTNSKPLTA